MAKRGPKPKTARTTRPRAAPAAPKPWACPPHLRGEARKAWVHVVGLLRRAGNLGRTDPILVEAYALNAVMLRLARESIDQHGITLEDRLGIEKISPAVAVANSATMRLKAIVDALGLCPATSKYAAETDGTTDKDSKWAGLLGVVG